jgi:hypothetical protein
MLRQLLFDIPGGGGNDLSREMDDVQGMRAGQPGGADPSNMSPQELHDTLWKASYGILSVAIVRIFLTYSACCRFSLSGTRS